MMLARRIDAAASLFEPRVAESDTHIEQEREAV
jgi:predicted component of type VI protein secretion system